MAESQVGEFSGPGKPTPLEKLEHESINLKFIDSFLKRGNLLKNWNYLMDLQILELVDNMD